MAQINPISGALSALSFANNGLTTGLGLVNQAVSLGQTAGLIDSNQDQQRDALRAQQDLALTQLQAQQQLNQQQSAQNVALESQRLAEQTRQANEDRQAALRRAVARQRAQFGASGVGSGTGSSQAVLLGLFDESDEERENRERLDNLRNQALNLGNDQLIQRNVLDSTQAAQRTQLQRATNF